MSNLKDLTWEHHKNAERQDFVKVLMSGNINPDLYATYLWNQHAKYNLLEAIAQVHRLFDKFPTVQRKKLIENDFNEIWNHSEPPIVCQSTHKYITHMKGIMNNAEAVMAHIYVLHMGDLSGGQMIAKKVPGSGTMYKFDGDVKELKEAIKSQTNDSMAEEAKWVFDCATELFQELMELPIEHYLESSDTVSE